MSSDNWQNDQKPRPGTREGERAPRCVGGSARPPGQRSERASPPTAPAMTSSVGGLDVQPASGEEEEEEGGRGRKGGMAAGWVRGPSQVVLSVST